MQSPALGKVKMQFYMKYSERVRILFASLCCVTAAEKQKEGGVCDCSPVIYLLTSSPLTWYSWAFATTFPMVFVSSFSGSLIDALPTFTKTGYYSNLGYLTCGFTLLYENINNY